MKFPRGIQTFSKLREKGCLYIDKTELIFNLISTNQAYFLARPRRFGKSLLISTLESLFNGQQELFKDLAIAETNYDFQTYPVIKLEFTSVDARNQVDLQNFIINMSNEYAAIHHIELSIESYEQRFAELVKKLQHKYQQNVVLLIDEYDRPILSNLNESVLSDIKQTISGFYSAIKALDAYLKFVFITGVSKFAKVSVFSGMNNLTDISMRQDYATLCGITQQELTDNFSPAIKQLANTEQQDEQATIEKIKYWYNGYRFHHKAPGVYNPYSLLSLFETQEFDNYWFETGTPTFLIKLIENAQFDLTTLDELEVDKSAFMSIEPEQIGPLVALLQTGYLSIASYDDGWYTLDFPNLEVKYAFSRALMEYITNSERGVNVSYIRKLAKALNSNDLNTFFDILRIFFANIPYEITVKNEKYYQSLFFAILTLLGFQLEAEVSTNQGRIDCTIQTSKCIYVIEFKLSDSAQAALQQIVDKQYAQKYLASGKQIQLVGVAFDEKSRSIGDYVTQMVDN